MDYMKHYNKLCESRAKVDRQKGLGEYFESHHVFPKSVCGDNPVLVLLTAREHYVAHWLIWKAYQQKFGNDNWRTIKMANAFWRTCNGNPEVRERSKSSRAYEVAKEAMAEGKRGRTKENDPVLAARSERMLGRTKENDPSVAAMAEKLRGEKNPSADLKKYWFIHKLYGLVWCTRYYLRTHFNKPSHIDVLFCKKPYKSHAGWSLYIGDK